MMLMENVSIRLFQEKDVAFAYKMTVAEQWNDRTSDIRRMFDYEPNGCFVAEVSNFAVGHVFTVNYGKLGWIGLLIVEAEFRRKGIATLLMEKAVNYLLRCGVETIKLEAVPEISKLYRKLGFIDEFDSLRFMGTRRKVISQPDDSTNLMKRERIAEIATFDAEYFGADRTKVLTNLYTENPRLCFTSHKGSDICGYIMCRKAKSGYKLGPLVCNPENPETASELLQRCMLRIGSDERIYVGVPATNKKAVELFQGLGFEQYSKSIRMYLGRNLETEDVNGIFAIGGPMKG